MTIFDSNVRLCTVANKILNHNQLPQPLGINVMKTDAQLQGDVMAELKRDNSINASKINVEVSGGRVILSGHVDSYSQKWSAERAAQKICGAKAVGTEILVVYIGTTCKSDTDISHTAQNVLDWTTSLPTKQLKVMVKSGWVTLSGELDHEYQRKLASNAVRNLIGVTGISNQIKVKQAVTANHARTNVQATL